MNQKNLNYEIETLSMLLVRRCSVAMNQKNLNYEIETSNVPNIPLRFTPPMNQKNLNYEIETRKHWAFQTDLRFL